MDLILIRHGECEASTPGWMNPDNGQMDPPLSGLGRRQALALAPRIAALRPAVILSSDLRRTMETADLVSASCDCPREINPAFREIHMGDIWTRGWDDFPDLHAAWMRHQEDLPYPGGENGGDVWDRCRPALEALCGREEGPIVIVTHGGVIRSVVCGMMNVPQQRRFFLGAPVVNTSMTWIQTGEPWWPGHIHIFNDFSHLDKTLLR
ncbi:MAG: histidine phosphatase family protein [Clostridiaceae bacterium]|nr:histidine phosphatase family protein [Clostridiaceae bacterium]